MPNTFTDLIESIKEWKVRFNRGLLDMGVYGREPLASLIVELEGYLDVLEDPTVSENLNNFSLARLHPIDRLGCGLVVTKLYEQGLSTKEISSQITTYSSHQVSEADVDLWLKDYQASPISQRRDKVNSSIFDTANQLELLAVRLSELSIQAEQTDDQIFAAARTTEVQVKLEIQKELRATVKDASSIIKAIHEMNTVKEMAKVIVEEIGRVDPKVQRAIYQSLRNKSVLFKTLGI
jgi:phage terminase Nu1 subunit (DNA packaging protein)